jgi:hypothetical protein
MKKNILAENLLRFGVKNLSEADIKKLHEQTVTATDSGQQQTPPVKLAGNAASALQNIPGLIIKPTKNVTPPSAYIANENVAEFLINYLGGYQSYLKDVIGKTILVFRDSLYKKEVTNTTFFSNFNTDESMPLAFIPKAYYVGQKSLEKGTGFTYFFDREITTNFSGDVNKPFINNIEQRKLDNETYSAAAAGAANADLIVQTKKDGGIENAAYPDNIKETLLPKWQHAGTRFNMLSIRHYDGKAFYNNKLIGNASYVEGVGIPSYGTYVGVNKVA